MRLDFYDMPEPVEMLVEMRLSGYPVETEAGDFQCSDALLQKIWEVGRYTTELCMDDGFMDCPWRERGQWLGDARVEALVAAYAFGDTRLAPEKPCCNTRNRRRKRAGFGACFRLTRPSTPFCQRSA